MLPPVHSASADLDVGSELDRLAGAEEVQSNCMFQLALMLARIALEPCAESYKAEAAEEMLAMMRKKPKTNVVRLFGSKSADRSNALRATSRCNPTVARVRPAGFELDGA